MSALLETDTRTGVSTAATGSEDRSIASIKAEEFVALPVVDHAGAAAAFNADSERTDWHDKSLWMVRQKRDKAAASVAEWEDLRQLASDIKDHTLGRLGQYLIEFEKNALANGVHVHWASDADEHNRIVAHILHERGARRLVKSKSMLTEECGLNHFLERDGIEVVDTDLGERIVQLAGEGPSHIVMPAIHYKKEEIGALFNKKLGTAAGATDPQYLTEAARKHLREKFFAADAALTGVNFAVAETGGVVVCTNEGNADLGVHLAPVHIASMGIEKLIPKTEHLGVFL
ncbi:MAG: lactate utilization protein, partial [Rhodothermales bacterium]|nr:lactate utilization protein [Rhodothermales bacterium]